MAEPNNYIVGSNTDETLIYKGQVVEVPDDPNGFKPIKCRLQTVDSSILKNEELSDCYPLLPKHLNVYPKKGEYVYILTLSKGSPQQIRYYIGPVIDTFAQLNYAPNDQGETNANIKSELNKQPEKGIYPSRNQVSIQGRSNSDIVFKDQEVLMRAGKYVSGDPLKFNSLDTGYIQIRYGEPQTKQTNKEKKTQIVKLATFDGFAIATLTNVIGPFSWIVNIRFEDNNNNFIGKIYKTFTSEDTATSFIRETFLDLKKGGSAAKSISLIKDPATGNQINVSNFSNYKFVNTSIPQLVKEGFDINPKTETTEKTEIVSEEEVVFSDSKGSAINIVSSKINLVSYGNKYGFKLLDPTTTITAEEQLKINTDSQPIPYGYILNDFLTLMKSFVASHVHAYHGLPPDPDPIVNQILNYDLESILNQNVRTA
jgi:hypothetical protein